MHPQATAKPSDSMVVIMSYAIIAYFFSNGYKKEMCPVIFQGHISYESQVIGYLPVATLLLYCNNFQRNLKTNLCIL